MTPSPSSPSPKIIALSDDKKDLLDRRLDVLLLLSSIKGRRDPPQMIEIWREIDSFPGYSVSDEGRVRNDVTDHIMALLINQFGIVNVGLTRNLIQHKRSVTLLVARAFVSKKENAFDTPINLNGDRLNNCAYNIVWRPRWFAVKYLHQFTVDRVYGIPVPIEEVKTKEQFQTSWDAAVKYGLLDREILVATLNHTYVWPTYQRFRVLPTVSNADIN